MGITTIGVGVVVLGPRTGEPRFKFKDMQRAFTDSESQGAIEQTLQNFKNELEQLSAPTEPLYLGDRYSLRGYLTFVGSHWMNIIRVDQVRSMDAADISDATQLLFDTLIGGQAQSDVKPGVRQLKRKNPHCVPLVPGTRKSHSSECRCLRCQARARSQPRRSARRPRIGTESGFQFPSR